MTVPRAPKASQLVHTKGTGCTGKRRYGDRAHHRAARMLRDKGDDVHAYVCPDHSGHWHVGHRGAS